LHRRKFLTVAAMWPTMARAHSYKHAGILIGHAWALPSTITDGQAFVPLINTNDAADTLVAARTGIASLVELRTNARYDDPPADGFALEPGEPFPMRPQARHLRLVGLGQPLKLGQRFNLILDFETAGEVDIEFHVESTPGN
jgi:periplasmic copper chaperone A